MSDLNANPPSELTADPNENSPGTTTWSNTENLMLRKGGFKAEHDKQYSDDEDISGDEEEMKEEEDLSEDEWKVVEGH